MKDKNYPIIGAILLGLVFLMSACGQAETTACPDCPIITPCPTAVPRSGPSVCPEPLVDAVPFEDDWANSGHGDAAAIAFRLWDEDNPQIVPIACAKCHTDTGFMDFVGGDGTEAGKLDAAQPVSNGITCEACHSMAASALSSVTFPSRLVITGLGGEARCMECHQGRASKLNIDSLLASFDVIEDLDVVPAPIKDGETEKKLGFVNIHYLTAAATLYGGQVKGGYEYNGKTYDVKNAHVPGYETCTGCHDAHTLEVKLDQCAACHVGVSSVKDLKNIRMITSSRDYDGDGNTAEGIAGEISGLQKALYAAIQSYATEVSGTGIVYSAADYPYFLSDADGDGKGDTSEDGSIIAYPAWTGRLLKAAYNYQVSIKDPGAYAHGSRYIIQLLFDSIEDLNAKLTVPLDMTGMNRDDSGHFAGSAEAFRHWDAHNYQVSSTCAKCHAASGLPAYLANHAARIVSANGSTTTIGMSDLPASNGFSCSTCHNEQAWPEHYIIASVVFPSGITVSLEGTDTDGLFIPDDSNLCLHCHQGNESTLSVDTYLFGKEDDTVNTALSFKNIHYSPAGATLLGSEVAGAYQYAGQVYDGYNNHPDNKCAECHDVHTLQINTSRCKDCHVDTIDVSSIRMYTIDFDGDGDVTEGIKGEIDTLATALYAQIQNYAETTAATPIIYNKLSNPYFFVDADNDGVIDLDRKDAYINYNAYTPRLLRAAYNYQFSQMDAGAYAHNPNYMIQILIDSIADLGGDVTIYIRP